jgi:hypothetical protein
MEFTEHREQFADTGETVVCFDIKTRKGDAHGFVHDGKLCIHHIYGEGSVKGIMSALCRRYKTNDFRFLMVINPQLKNIIHGRVVLIPPDAPGNPFGETIEEIHGTWEGLS